MHASGAASAVAMSEEAPAHTPEDQVRAHTYALLGALMSSPPSQDLLDTLATLELPLENPLEDSGGSEPAFAAAWRQLKIAAGRATAGSVRDEYQNLFVGLGRGEVMPYGSWYMTGFVMDKPLALLRADLAALGIERQSDVKEPEDHVAALCETMAMLVTDHQGQHDQRRFFDSHLAPWVNSFFRDLQGAKSAAFYKAVAQFGDQFAEFESRYLSMTV